MKTVPSELLHYIKMYLIFNFVGIVFGVYEVIVVVSAKLLSHV